MAAVFVLLPDGNIFFLQQTHAMCRSCFVNRSEQWEMAVPEYIQVVTTVARREEAESIAQTLVDRRLAACVQISGPITSVYRWRGKMETAEEWQCTAKSRRDLYPRIEEAIRRLHSYETPEILATPILAGSEAYVAWLEGELINTV